MDIQGEDLLILDPLDPLLNFSSLVPYKYHSHYNRKYTLKEYYYSLALPLFSLFISTLLYYVIISISFTTNTKLIIFFNSILLFLIYQLIKLCYKL